MTKQNCEVCGRLLGTTWGIEVVMGGQRIFHYFCGQKHANEWISKQKSYKMVGEIVDAE